jgi:hypothetical protein
LSGGREGILQRLSLKANLQKVTERTAWVSNTSTVTWLYDEVEQVPEGHRKHFVHSILFSNGWEIRLPFRDVHTTTVFPLLPHPRSVKTGEPPMPATQWA